MSQTMVSLEGISQRYNQPPSSLEEQICYYARVSNPSSQIKALNNEGLIKYLIRNAHWSPFEQVTINCQIDTTRDIGRQAIRHRTFYFQEYSQRYSVTTSTDVIRETRLQDKVNRQNSLQTDDEELIKYFEQVQLDVSNFCHGYYNICLEKNIAKEQARALLPEGLTWTRFYMHGTVRSWIHYIELRTKPETQKEHREIALMCADVIRPVFPRIDDFVYNEEREREKRYKLYLDLRKEFSPLQKTKDLIGKNINKIF